MLLKNIYIFFPPGYGGNYLSWLISSCDVDVYKNLVKSPVNTTASNQYGGQGTSHLHERFPTHHAYSRTVAWICKHRPASPRIYLINYDSLSASVAHDIVKLAMFDETGIFITISADKTLGREFAVINAVTKWPSFLHAARTQVKNKCLQNVDGYKFNPFTLQHDMMFRNNAVVYDKELFYSMCAPSVATLSDAAMDYNNWFAHRNELQPHEVNSEQYINFINLDDRVFNISNTDIVCDDVLAWLENFVVIASISDNVNLSPSRDYHQSYIDAQNNLQFFRSMAVWISTGKLDSYLTSHAIIQAQVIKLILSKHNIRYYHENEISRWKLFYVDHKQPDWPDILSKTSTPSDIQLLPAHIREFIISTNQIHDYPGGSVTNIDLLNWKNMTIEQINNVNNA